MKASEIRELSAEQRAKKLAELKEELFNLHFQAAINQLENPMRIKAVKKDIARIKTTKILHKKNFHSSQCRIILIPEFYATTLKSPAVINSSLHFFRSASLLFLTASSLSMTITPSKNLAITGDNSASILASPCQS